MLSKCCTTVNLILADGAQLTANEGICVNQGNTFIVYAQSEDKATMGKLTSTGTDYNAGIGGNKGNDNGTVIINGGIINITGGKFAAGIGGGQAGHGGIVTINGGILTVNAGRFGAEVPLPSTRVCFSAVPPANCSPWQKPA